MKVAFAALVLRVSAVSLAGAGEQPTRFKVTTQRKDDTVKVRADKGRTLFTVRSPFGMSQAGIERTGDRWLEAVVPRPHLITAP